MTDEERKKMMITADTINGELNRMCVTNDLSEFYNMYEHAKRNLYILGKIILDSKFRSESEDK